MRRPSFRAQLVVGFIGVVLAAEALTLVLLDRALSDDLIAELDVRLVAQAEGAASWISQRRADREGSEPAYERHADRLAHVVGAWVTVFDPSGEVLGDSELEDEDERAREEANSAEIAAARDGGIGRATRWSEHHAAQMYLVAVTASNGAIVRLGVPLSAIEATRAHTRARLVVAALLASVVALVLALLAARLVARPVRAMTRAAERIARGDYEVVLSDPTPDELGILARTLTSLAAELRARVGELVSERDRLSAVLTGMVEGVLVSDGDGVVVLANPSARQLLAREPVGLRVSALLEHPDIDALLAGRPERPFCELSSADRTLAVTVQRQRGERDAGAVIVLHDVTERQRLESMRRDFVAQISHELRTPVAAIQGYAETLIGGRADDATRAEFLEVIHRQALRMGRLVADLLRLAELEARPAEQIKDEPILVAAVTAHVLETVRERAAAASVRLTAEVDASVRARGDPDDLEQVLENLVDNAIRYGASTGTVRILARTIGDTVELEVADDGEGIPAEHLPRLFERFYRVDAARSRKLGGTGLGLAIVKRMVTAMRGEVRAESRLGKGTRFLVILPADVAPT